jgi:hypothetical protein
MRYLLGSPLRMSAARNWTIAQRIRHGREWLVQTAGGLDFGYDALRWHEHLWTTNAGGYRGLRRSADKWAKHVRDMMAKPGWAEAVQELEAEEQRRAEPDAAADKARKGNLG